MSCEIEDDAAARRERKKAKLLEQLAVIQADEEREAAAVSEAKRLKIEAKHAAAAAELIAAEAEVEHAKQRRKAAQAKLIVAEGELAAVKAKLSTTEKKKSKHNMHNMDSSVETRQEPDEVAAKAAKKAAKRAVADAEALACEATEAKRLRKAAKRAALAEDEADMNGVKRDDALVPSHKSESSTTKANSGPLTVFVGCLPFNCSKDVLSKDFSECGDIENLIMPESADGRPGGFAFITYRARPGALEALKYNGEDYGGRKIVVKLDGKVFVKGLANDASDADVKELFADCGHIQSLKVSRWPDGGCKGTAHINFSTSEGLEKALQLNGQTFGSSRISVQQAAQSGSGKGNSKDKSGDTTDSKNGSKKGKGKSKSKGKGTPSVDKEVHDWNTKPAAAPDEAAPEEKKLSAREQKRLLYRC